MPRKRTDPAPTDEEILRHNNVPVDLAARYIGWSAPTIYYALQEERAPFGFAVKSPRGGWTYNISPGALVKYKHGELPAYKLREVIDLAAEGVEKVLDARLAGMKKVLNAIGGPV